MGWYFMVPPISLHHQMDNTAPLAFWHIGVSFDTAKEMRELPDKSTAAE
jgi:hypothetical protein